MADVRSRETSLPFPKVLRPECELRSGQDRGNFMGCCRSRLARRRCCRRPRAGSTPPRPPPCRGRRLRAAGNVDAYSPDSRSSCAASRASKPGSISRGASAITVMPVPGLCDPGEGRRVERPVGAVDAGREHLDHQRDVGAAVAAEGEQRALHGGSGRWSACPRRPAPSPRGCLPAFGGVADVDEGGGARRLVDDQRRAAGDRRGEGHRIGAIDRLGRAGTGEQRRAVGGRDRRQPSLGQPAGEIAERAAGEGVLLREQREAERCAASTISRRRRRSRDARRRPWRRTG